VSSRFCRRFLRYVLLLCAVAAPSGWARADLAPYGRKRFVSADRTHYVCVLPVEGGESLWPRSGSPRRARAEFRFVRASRRSDRVEPSYESSLPQGDPFGGGFVRDGDVVLRAGTLEELPLRVVVANGGMGFAALDTWGAFGGGRVVIGVSSEGVVTAEFGLNDLWSPEQIAKLPRTSDQLQWLRLAWFSASASEFIVVPNADLPWRKLDLLASGRAVQGASTESLSQAIEARSVFDTGTAWEIAKEMQVLGLAKSARSLVADSIETAHARLRAIDYLLSVDGAGDAERDLIRRTAISRASMSDVSDAIAMIPRALGSAAIPLLVDLLVDEPEGLSDRRAAVVKALGEAGPTAAERLVTIVGDASRTPQVRARAAVALGSARSRSGLTSLLRVLSVGGARGPDVAVMEAAAESLASYTDDREVLRDPLLEHLRSGGTATAVAARYFALVKEPASIPLLIRALRDRQLESSTNETDVGSIVDALRYQTGMDFGRDPAKWERWVSGK
jgi:hypothetical protein